MVDGNGVQLRRAADAQTVIGVGEKTWGTRMDDVARSPITLQQHLRNHRTHTHTHSHTLTHTLTHMEAMR